HLDDDGVAGNFAAPAQDAQRHARRRHADDRVVREVRQVHADVRLREGDVVAKQQLAGGVPDLRPGMLFDRLFAVPRDAAFRRLFDHHGGPLEVAAQLLVEDLGGAAAHVREDGARVDAEDERHGRDVPQRQLQAHAVRSPPAPHGSPSRSRNPTPRTVWINFIDRSRSTLRRRRAMWTSMTLSSGVVRAVSFQTSRASVSRETTCPSYRIRYSSSSNSRTVSSTGCALRVTLRVTRSISRSPTDSRGVSATRPRRTNARMRASSSAKANGLIR